MPDQNRRKVQVPEADLSKYHEKLDIIIEQNTRMLDPENGVYPQINKNVAAIRSINKTLKTYSKALWIGAAGLIATLYKLIFLSK